MNKNKGFTLIELLVVIAIIGILSSVVLASLSSARTKGQVAAIQSTMSSLRAQAEVGMTNGKYLPNLCTTATSNTTPGGLKTLLDSIYKTATPSAKGTRMICGQDVAASTTVQPYKWGAQIDLPTNPVTTFCADSTGYSGIITASSTKIVTGSSTTVSCQ